MAEERDPLADLTERVSMSRRTGLLSAGMGVRTGFEGESGGAMTVSMWRCLLTLGLGRRRPLRLRLTLASTSYLSMRAGGQQTPAHQRNRLTRRSKADRGFLEALEDRVLLRKHAAKLVELESCGEALGLDEEVGVQA